MHAYPHREIARVDVKGVTAPPPLPSPMHAAAGLNEFVRRYETLHLRANFTAETEDKVTARFQFRAHGR